MIRIRRRAKQQEPSDARSVRFVKTKGSESNMRSKFWCAVTAMLLMPLLAAPGAFAAEDNFRATVFGSGSFLKGERSFTVDGDTKRTNFAKGGKFGVRGTLDLTSHWAVEGAYGYGTNNLRIFDTGAPTRERAFGTRVHQVTGNVSYYLSGSGRKLRPFVTAGVGLIRFNPTSKARAAAAIEFVDEPATISSNTKTEFNYGAGVE